MTQEEVTVSVVVKIYQGIIEDVIAFGDLEAANRCFKEWIREHISKEDIEQMGEKTALEYSDINGSTVYSACAVDFIPVNKDDWQELLKTYETWQRPDREAVSNAGAFVRVAEKVFK